MDHLSPADQTRTDALGSITSVAAVCAHSELLDYADGNLANQPLYELARHIREFAQQAGQTTRSISNSPSIVPNS